MRRRKRTPWIPNDRQWSAILEVSVIRTFFTEIQAWEWIPRRFSPSVALRTPPNVRRHLGPRPRDLQDDVWAKLLYAGISLADEDIERSAYPPAYTRAALVIWLFAALRKNELRRLETECVSWEASLVEVDADGNPHLPICYLRIPANKYKNEYQKPVDRIVGQAIEAWARERAKGQPSLVDPITGRSVDLLFCHRGRLMGKNYFNGHLIPKICQLAGVPIADGKGKITTHRARSTIATQLANAEDAMSALDLKEWLGHESLSSTMYYVSLRPKRLAKKLSDAQYFRNNMARLNVIVDRNAIMDGSAAEGRPYMQYDLGHGYCGDRFFSRCPHRMACARCSYYTPKDSHKAELLEASKENERLSIDLALRGEEADALKGDNEAIRKLVSGLRDIPANDGRTPRQIEFDGQDETPEEDE